MLDVKLKSLLEVPLVALHKATEAIDFTPLEHGGFVMDAFLPGDSGLIEIAFDEDGYLVSAWWQVGDVEEWREWVGDGGDQS